MKKKWPMVKLGEVLRGSKEPIEIRPDDEYQEIKVRLWGKGIIQRGIVKGAEVSFSSRFVARAGQLIISRIDARNGALGIVTGRT